LTATSTLNQPIGVPPCAVSISRAFRFSDTAKITDDPDVKKVRRGTNSKRNALAVSDEEEIEDIMFLVSGGEEEEVKGKGKGAALAIQ